MADTINIVHELSERSVYFSLVLNLLQIKFKEMSFQLRNEEKNQIEI